MLTIPDKFRDIIDEALYYLRSSNYVWQEGRLEHIDAALVALSQPAPAGE